MKFPTDLRYTEAHEWARLEGGTVTIGITDHAQSSLGDIVFLELPEKGKKLKPGEPFGVVESIKAVSDVYAPIEGEVIDVQTSLASEPGLVNQDPYGKGWMIKIKATQIEGFEKLMNASQYEKYVGAL